MHEWYGLRPADGGACCPRRLIGRLHCVRHRHYGHYPNAPDEPCLCIKYSHRDRLLDHTRMWHDERGRLVYTTEPYDATPAHIAEFTAELAAEGISVTVGDRSPGYPGATTLLLLTGSAHHAQ